MQLLFLPTRGALWIDGLLSLALSSCSISICICITSGTTLVRQTLPTIYNYSESGSTNSTTISSATSIIHALTISSNSERTASTTTTTNGVQTRTGSRLITDNVHPCDQLTFYNGTNTNNTIVKADVGNGNKEANASASSNVVTATLFRSDSAIVHSSGKEGLRERGTDKEKFRWLWLRRRLFGKAEGESQGIVSGKVIGRKRSGSDSFLLRSSGSGSERSRRDAHAHLPVDTEPSGVSYSSASSDSATVSSVTSSDSVGIRLDDEYFSVQDAFVEGSHLWTLLVAGYSLVFTVGVIGNSVLLAALCGSGSRARALPVRNHLMVNLAAADLLVTAICVPISACDASSHACWPGFLVPWMCQLGPLLQRTPVAASTLSLALLSLDRWAAIRHPRFAQRFRERRFVAMSMACIWILASLVTAPTLWVRQWNDAPEQPWAQEQSSQHPQNSSGGNNFTRNSSTSDWGEFEADTEWGRSGQCMEGWTNEGMQMAYAATYIGTAFVSPALIVAACHASVSQKLTAQLQVLTGADRISSRPRPKQVIIVARDLTNNPNLNANANGPLNGNGNPVNAANLNGHGAVNAGGTGPPTIVIDPPKPSMKLVPCDPNSDDDDIYLRMQIEADLESFRQLSQLQQNQNKTNQGNLRGMKFHRNTGRSGSQTLNVPTTNGKLGTALRAARRETSIIRAHRRLRKKFNVPSASATNKQPPPLLPTYSSQSFRSRRRAANLLAALAAVFVFCWAPYVLCAICEIFLPKRSWIKLVIPFSLFLGHVHSAINPVVSWRLNRSAFVRFQRQPIFSFLPDWSWLRFCRTCTAPCCCCFCCCPTQCNCDCGCGGCCSWVHCPGQRHPHLHRTNTRYPHQHNQNNLHPLQQQQSRIHTHNPSETCTCRLCNCCYCPNMFTRRRSSSPDIWNRNSSTNEAQLGAFHPKYLSRMPAPDPISKCHTSHFLR